MTKRNVIPLTNQQERLPAFQDENLASLKRYIRHPEFKVLLNNLVHGQTQRKFKSLALLTEDNNINKSFFICALALGYTCYLQSRVLIVETIHQPKDRSLFLDCILGEHRPEAGVQLGVEPGYIDLLSTESFFDGENDLADFHLGEYIQQVQSRYDIVLVNTAPLSWQHEDTIHPFIISTYVDQSVLLLPPSNGKDRSVTETIESLESNNIPLFGIIECPAGVPS